MYAESYVILHWQMTNVFITYFKDFIYLHSNVLMFLFFSSTTYVWKGLLSPFRDMCPATVDHSKQQTDCYRRTSCKCNSKAVADYDNNNNNNK